MFRKFFLPNLESRRMQSPAHDLKFAVHKHELLTV